MATVKTNSDPAVLLRGPFDLVRALLTRFFVYIGEISILVGRTGRHLARGAVDLRDCMTQSAVIGYNSVPIAVLTTFTSGAVISLYFSQFAERYGVGQLTGGLVALALSRELAPMLVGVVVAARAGSAIAAEIGTMKVTEQIDALRALAVSPIQYLVVPRLLASLIMLPVLCVIADIAGLVGGYVIAVWQGIPAASFPVSIREEVVFRDFQMGIIKTVVFGLIIAIVSCHQGLETRGGATGVGRATTNAVVLSIVLIYVADFFLAYFMFGSQSTL
ncbi:MAG TPA: ABC transporter permease [Capsulimonadaceae bacterium]|nr:ABC transporter permease [Capsulimonadaceae bacterium]